VTDVDDDGGVRVVHVVTAPGRPVCPDCATASEHPKCYVVTSPRDLPAGGLPVRLVWHKRRWYCRSAGCRRASFTEAVPQVPPRARITSRLRVAAGVAVRDGGCTIAQSARDHGLSWPTVAAAFTAVARLVLPDEPPETALLGIDETRRGRPRYRLDPHTGQRVCTAERWHTGFVDLAGAHGLLGQVPGRAAADAGAWLAARTPGWRAGVRVVAIDMCSAYRAAVRQHLPHARLVVDHFHLVQLANRTVAEVRRRVVACVRGRRGRKSDPEYGVRRRLGRNLEDLRDGQLDDMFTRLATLGGIGEHIKCAYIAKEELRTLLTLARTGANHHQIRHRLTVFYTWCAAYDIPELHRLASTVEQWWPEILAFIDTGITNAASEGTNRVIKLEARNAYGFRNPTNQQLRSRAASTRRHRRTLTTHRPRSRTG
jgi:transposase